MTFKAAAAVIALAALVGCHTMPQVVTVTSSTTDATPPGAIWMQADVPGQPLANVYLRDPNAPADVSVTVNSSDVIKIAATSTDNDSGVKRLELYGLLTSAYVSNGRWQYIQRYVSTNFGGVTSVPVPGPVPLTAKVNTTIDFGQLSAGADWVSIQLVAVAESGAPPASGTPAKTDILSLSWKRAGTPPLNLP
jgi:hypothetical protein